MITLTDEEYTALYHAQGTLIDDDIDAAYIGLEVRGLIRPIISFNPAHYETPVDGARIYPHIGYDFSGPKYAYTHTALGAEVLTHYDEEYDIEELED